MAPSFLRFTLLFITAVSTAVGFRFYKLDICKFTSAELKDIEYIRSIYYNKVEYTRFSSTVGKFVGYNLFGMKAADYWNSQTLYLSQMRKGKENTCKHNIWIWYNTFLIESVEPTVRLSSTSPPAGNHPAMLVCSVYSFYPKQIKVYWTRDGHEVSTGVTSTEEMSDGDWYYQVHSDLEYTPRSRENISCVVEHASLKQPLVTHWDPSMPESMRNQIAIGASGLILGLILTLAGFTYYKWKGRGRILVPTS